MKISVVGTGYVGLVTGTCLAEVGHSVLCLDLDRTKIERLKKGIIPIYEPGLEELVKKNIEQGRLRFSDNVEESVQFGKIQMIAVGTPPGEDGSADLQYIVAAAQEVGKFMQDAKIIVNKSTVPVGTADLVKKTVAEQLLKRNVDLHFEVVSNPEFLKEGAAVDDFMRPDRIIVGVDSRETADVMKALYAPFERNHDKMIIMDTRSAEFTKYAANAMLATRISFMNELTRLADKLGADIEWVRKGIGSDPRIGYSFLYSGVGYGGSCFPKDVKALIHMGKENDVHLEVLNSVEQANREQKRYFTNKILRRFDGNLAGKKIAIWGLAFKPNTDDMREAPSIEIISQLLKAGAQIRAYDPVANAEARKVFEGRPQLEICENSSETIKDVDALVVLTEWTEFKSLDFAELKSSMKSAILFDGRNIYSPKECLENGFEYIGLGRKI